MVFNGTFNNVSVISSWSVPSVEEIGVPEKTTNLSQVIACMGFELTAYVVIGHW